MRFLINVNRPFALWVSLITGIIVVSANTTDRKTTIPTHRMLYKNSFTAKLTQGATSGDVTIQNTPSEGMKYVKIAVTDQSTSHFTANNLVIDKTSKINVHFKYRSSASISGCDRGSWVYICYYKSGGTSIGSSFILCQPTALWKKTTQTVIVPELANTCSIQFRLQQQNGKFDIADRSINPG